MKTKLILLTVAWLAATAITTPQQVNVKTLFGMLLAEGFVTLGNETPGSTEPYINVCDTKNGYLRLESKYGTRLEMCYWNLKNGDKLIAVSVPLSYDFYLYSNGKITGTTDFGIGELQTAVSESIANNCCDNWVDFHAPRYDTSIYLTVNGLDAQIYKWRNQRFVRLNEYPAKNSTHQQLVKGFTDALKAGDADRCLQYIAPGYVSEQCMSVFEGNKEQFLCDLISGEDKKGYIKPTKLSDIKKATYRYTPDDGFANHKIFIELKNGRSYTYYPSMETVEIFEILPGGEDGKLLRATPYIIGGVG